MCVCVCANLLSIIISVAKHSFTLLAKYDYFRFNFEIDYLIKFAHRLYLFLQRGAYKVTSQTQKMFNLSIQINVANKVFIDLKHVFQRLSTVTNVSKFQGMEKKIHNQCLLLRPLVT